MCETVDIYCYGALVHPEEERHHHGVPPLLAHPLPLPPLQARLPPAGGGGEGVREVLGEVREVSEMVWGGEGGE